MRGRYWLSLFVAAFWCGWAGAVTSIPYRSLAEGVGRMAAMPDGATFNLTFKSKIDGSRQPLLVRVPQGYTPERKWPLLVTLHGRGGGPILAPKIESMLQIGPSGRGSVDFTGIGETDVFECLDLVARLLSIDEDRVYLCGFSMGARATFYLGLKYPDRWAACVPVCGNWLNLEQVENARHLPFWIHTGAADIMMPPKYSKAVYEKAGQLGIPDWRYTEVREMGHAFAIDWPSVERWLLEHKRVTHPRRITYSLNGLEANRAYWLQVEALAVYGEPARIEAVADGRRIDLQTRNVANYRLWFDESPLDLSGEVTVTENGAEIYKGPAKLNVPFIKTAQITTPVKRPGLSGPLWDIYSQTCILAYGTHGDDQAAISAARQCAGAFADPGWMGRVIFSIRPDTDITPKHHAAVNIVLFGNPKTNSVMASLSERLPVRMQGNQVKAGSSLYSAEHIGYVLICPNPQNPDRYVAVFAGNTPTAIDCFSRVWPTFTSPVKAMDYGVFECNPADNTVRWLYQGVFGSNWGWQ
jgi:dienelactone hydrolase